MCATYTKSLESIALDHSLSQPASKDSLKKPCSIYSGSTVSLGDCRSESAKLNWLDA